MLSLCLPLLPQVGFTSAGRLTSLDLQLYSNAGYGQDVSIDVSNESTAGADASVEAVPKLKVTIIMKLPDLAT